MDLSSVRSLALDAVFSAHGVPATVTRPDENPITTRVLWVPDNTGWGATDETHLEILKVVSRRVMALRLSEVSAAPVGTIVTAPAAAGQDDLTWRVDEIGHQEPELIRVFVQPMRDSSHLEAWGKSS
jgi:hypothetical protein